MKKLITILLVSLSLTSCVTQKQRAKICRTCAIVTESKDSIREVVIHDTLTLPPIVGPIQYLENPCKELCDSLGNLKPFKKVEHRNGITSTVKSIGNSIAFQCDADSLKAYITKIEKEHFRNKESVQMIPCNLQHTSSFSGFTLWWFWITAGLLVLLILWKALKKYIKPI